MTYRPPVESVSEAYKPRGNRSLAGMQGARPLSYEEVNSRLAADLQRPTADPFLISGYVEVPPQGKNVEIGMTGITDPQTIIERFAGNNDPQTAQLVAAAQRMAVSHSAEFRG